MLTVYDNFKEQQTKLMDLLTSDEYQTYEKAFEPSKSTSNGSKNSLYKEFKRLQSAVLLLNILVDATEGNRDNDSVDLRSAAIHALEFYQNSTRCQEKNIVLGGKVRFFCNKESKEDRQRVFKIIQSYFAELNLPKVVALIPYILLDNAIKYTPAKYYNNPDIKNDQNKQINFIFAQEDDGKMAMSISNVGPKYSDEQIAKLCEKDFRPEVAREHTSEGYGLGLYFVSRILRNCGASITFSSGDTIWTDNDIEYSEFCIKIKFDVNECEENVLQETTDFFLHEYNNILVNLNNSVTKIKTNINNNLEGICSVKNLDQDKLCDFLENLNEKARDYRLALLCYVFVYNPQFVKIDEETSNTKYNFDFLEELKKATIWSFVSEYALTYGKYQVVTKYFGEPDYCVGQFDFKHNMHYYIPGTMKILCAYEEELDDTDADSDFDDYKYLQTNELVFNENRARDIEGVWLRVEKFTSRGMTVSKETKKKIKKRTTKKAIKKYKKNHRGGGRNYYQ